MAIGPAAAVDTVAATKVSAKNTLFDIGILL
jgi:hypothetical protein